MGGTLLNLILLFVGTFLFCGFKRGVCFVGTVVCWGYIIKFDVAFCGNGLVLWVQKGCMFCGNNVIWVYTLFKSVSGKMLV
ncbi:hypothetical protein AW729_07260 [Methanosphaera sp. BMS]|nr:hypothetical protein AW729_07260 [Methanosphaera sp. BMS]